MINIKKIGKNVKIFETTKIAFPENVEIGSNVIIDDFVLIIAKKSVKIGNYVHIASFSSLTGNETIILEDFSGLSSGVRIFSSSDLFSGNCLTNPTVPAEYRKVISKAVIIKKHSIIGANTVILPGITIGEGAAVGANSLVTKNLEPWTVYFGTPCKAIKKRNKEKILELSKELYKKL